MGQQQNTAPGVLYVVATPIGNLADISSRAIEVLGRVDAIAAEDTRHSSRLLQHLGISNQLLACHEHNERDTCANLVRRLEQGQNLALISDAGTPLISDPGYHLVEQVRAAGIRVVPIPGASAMLAALSAAGLPSDRFVFEGFLPAKSAARCKHLQQLEREPRTMIFYEAPHRLLASVQDMAQIFGGTRQAVLARELTKTFETIKGASLEELAQWIEADANQQRGESVVLVRGAPPHAQDDGVSEESQRILRLLCGEMALKKAAALTAQITGERKNQLYRWGLEQSL